MKKGKTLFDKIWDNHVVHHMENGPDIIYIDRHLIHEVTSPQAFAGLEARNLNVFRTSHTLATADHNVPTIDQHLPIKEVLSRKQVEKLEENCSKYNIKLFGLGHPNQGIVHVIAPELGVTLPGMTLVCGDSHTSTHGAFGTIAFGIGTSEVEQVFASQCLLQEKPRSMRITFTGKLQNGVGAKDIILYVLSLIGTNGATGHFIEFAGSALRRLSMEERMTICNMSIELGARGGLIAPDATTFRYLLGRPYTPVGMNYAKALSHWQTLYSDRNAVFEKELDVDVTALEPMVTYGTNPGMGIPVSSFIPEQETSSGKKALDYMGWKSGDRIAGKKISHVFIGSCTNARIEDLRAAAELVRGKKIANGIHAFVVPGSRNVLNEARLEKLDQVFCDAGFEFREPGCSACLGMNEDKIPEGAWCVSTSNRNFEGRQGQGARTILASPLTAAAAALKGCITDVRSLL
ncbi:MAG: 3-isopropylmalate dehydratase large subunit [Bacteroidia bacterium]